MSSMGGGRGGRVNLRTPRWFELVRCRRDDVRMHAGSLGRVWVSRCLMLTGSFQAINKSNRDRLILVFGNNPSI